MDLRFMFAKKVGADSVRPDKILSPLCRGTCGFLLGPGLCFRSGFRRGSFLRFRPGWDFPLGLRFDLRPRLRSERLGLFAKAPGKMCADQLELEEHEPPRD